jgi:hypothetical protein
LFKRVLLIFQIIFLSKTLKSKIHFFLHMYFYFIYLFLFIYHICIHFWVISAPFRLSPPLLPSPTQFQAGPFCPYLWFCWRKDVSIIRKTKHFC